MKKLLAIILSLGLIIAPMPVAHASGGGGYLKQILGISNGIMGSAILIKCKLGATQFSLPVYMAGGVVFVLAEIMGGKKKAKDSDDQSKQLDEFKNGMAEGGDYQKAAIQAQIDDQKSNLEFVQKRRKWMMAVKVIYIVATALAVMEMVLRYPPVFKPDLAGCGPDFMSHKPATALIATAYGSLMASGGNLKGMAVGMAVKMAVKKFLPQVTIGADIADKAISILNPAEGRIAFFGATTALVFIIDAGLAKEQKQIEKNIADLEKVKATLPGSDNAIAEGTATSGAEAGAAGGAGVGGVNDPTKRQYALKQLPQGVELAKNCFSQSSTGAADYSTSACKNPVKLTRPKFDANFQIPALKAGANTSMDLAQALADGDLARADIEAGNLNAQAGRLEKIKDDLLKKANERLKAEGKKPIDINGELQRQVTDLNKALNQASPGSGNYSLADLDGGEAAVSETPSGDTASGVTTASTTASVALPAPGEGIDISDIGGEGLTENLVDPNGANVATLDESLNQFESSESDIAKDPGVSIFKQVSNRYFLNYTKIFNRKEINPPLKEEPAPTP